MKRIAALFTAACLWACTLPVMVGTTGCTGPTDAQVAADGAAIATALTNIANVYSVTAPAAAAQLKTYAADILSVTANWNSSTGIALFNSAANGAEIILAGIPQTKDFAPLIPIAVAAIDILVANLNPAATAPATLQAHVLAAPQGNPYRGRATIKHRMLRSPEGDFKATWNETAKANGLSNLALR